ncbi:DUF2851 family protein [Limibacter armeniacum]|uniref:DUF2851 family protein n=1 Tax=Limibacter armeniacum TaxID=466084 RepID=UPI002FE64134
MKEDFLYFLWQFQYFHKHDLYTDEGEPLQVLYQGYQNEHSGPDFSEVRINIAGIEWAGNVEIHVKSSDWYMHGHQNNRAYDNTVLHVVWHNDKAVSRTDGTLIPTLSLQNLVDQQLLEKYKVLKQSLSGVACKEHFLSVNRLTKLAMLDRVMMERLERKAEEVLGIWQGTGGDWEETAYRLLSRSLGGSANKEAFLRLAGAVPFKRILQHVDQPAQVEAMLFGQSGLLPEVSDENYPTFLKKEYSFLSHKYAFGTGQMKAEEWKFARLRPAGFPTMRIAQLSAILTKNHRFFSKLILLEEQDALMDLLEADVSEYWQEHYFFGKKGKGTRLGKQMISGMIINTVVPLLVAFSRVKGVDRYQNKAIQLLERLPSEQNKIIRDWKALGLHCGSAFDTQACIELYNNYCKSKRCLSCCIGVNLLKRQKA